MAALGSPAGALRRAGGKVSIDMDNREGTSVIEPRSAAAAGGGAQAALKGSWLGAATAAVLTIALSAATLTARQSGPDRSKPPVPGPAPVLKTPPIERRTLSNGLPVWIVEMHQVPVVDLS